MQKHRKRDEYDRVTISISTKLEAKVRAVQAERMIKQKKNVSFSEVVADLLTRGLKLA